MTSFQRTYEELKQEIQIPREYIRQGFQRTYEELKPITGVPIAGVAIAGFQRTYEELKLASLRGQQPFQHVFSVPMRN